jgi:hypothetical protein
MGVYKKGINWYIDYYLPNGKRKREKVGPSKKTKFARLPDFRYNEDWEGYAGVAESVDALDSKSSGVYPPVWVRLPPPAP